MLSHKEDNVVKSEFKGGVIAYFFFTLLTDVVIILSLGFAYPAMKGVYLRWQTKKTFVDGQQLAFTGSAKKFYGRFLVMYALSLLTLGIYYVVKMQVELLKWEISNIHAENRMDFISGADIKWYKYIGLNILCNLVNAITLGIAEPFVRYERTMWLCEHIYINGMELCLIGDVKNFFFKNLLWYFLTVITLGIYDLWAEGKAFKLLTSYVCFYDKRYITERTIYLHVALPRQKPEEPTVALAPVKGETFAKVCDFLKLKRAMLCFMFEIPFMMIMPIIFAFINPILLVYMPAAVFICVLLSLPAIFYVDERHKKTDEINLQGCMAISIIGIILSVIEMPVFLPVFIGGLVETVKMKKYLYTDYKNKELSASGKNFIPEEEQYYRDAAEYQTYLWTRSAYRKSYKRYVKSVLDYNYGLVWAHQLADK